MAKEEVIAGRLIQFQIGSTTRAHLLKMLAYPKNTSFWQGHKLHVLVAMLVLMLHGALVYALWRARAGSLPETAPVAVRLINETTPPAVTVATPSRAAIAVALPSKLAPTPTPAGSSVEISAHPAAPVETMASAYISSVGDAQPNPTESPAVSVGVIADVSLACPVRAAPVYPLTARKLGETGKVVLRVELDETGRLVASDVARSSGFTRLDEAALAAVKSWRCQPAMRAGQALRVVSMESFDFRLGD